VCSARHTLLGLVSTGHPISHQPPQYPWLSGCKTCTGLLSSCPQAWPLMPRKWESFLHALTWAASSEAQVSPSSGRCTHLAGLPPQSRSCSFWEIWTLEFVWGGTRQHSALGPMASTVERQPLEDPVPMLQSLTEHPPYLPSPGQPVSPHPKYQQGSEI
jgi:hypothetical protein